MAHGPLLLGQGGVLDLKGETPPIGEHREDVRDLPVGDRLVVNLDTGIGVVRAEPRPDDLLARVMEPGLGRMTAANEIEVGEMVALRACLRRAPRVLAAQDRTDEATRTGVGTHSARLAAFKPEQRRVIGESRVASVDLDALARGLEVFSGQVAGQGRHAREREGSL